MTFSRCFGWGLAVAGASVFLTGMPGVAAAGGVKVLRSIPYAAESDAPEKVKDECKLQTKVPHFLSEYAGDVELVDGSLGSSGRTLTLEIGDVHASGGGAFSGPKTVTVTGVLRENGKSIGNFVATRFSGGGAFGFYKGTCAIAGRCAKAIGKDIADWLKSPGKDSRLGDA
jgi:hypothetical protein